MSWCWWGGSTDERTNYHRASSGSVWSTAARIAWTWRLMTFLFFGYEKKSRTLFSEWLTGGWQLGDLLFLEPIWKELVIRLGMYRTTANHQLSIIGVVIVNHRSCSPKHPSQSDDAGVSWRSYGPLLDHCKFISDPKNDCPKPLVACDLRFRTTVCQVWTWGWA